MKPIQKYQNNNNNNNIIEQSNNNFNNNNLIKIINEYNKTIKISEWELKLFIELCCKLKCLKIGKEILEDYVKLQQDIYKLIEKRKSYINKFILQLSLSTVNNSNNNNSNNNNNNTTTTVSTLSSNIPPLSSRVPSPSPSPVTVNHPSLSVNVLNYQELSHIIMKCAEYSLKSWIAICRLRQLQSNPQPIMLQFESQNLFYIDEFQTDILQLINLLKEKNILLINPQDNWIYLLILFVTSGLTKDFQILQNLFDFNDINSHQRNIICSLDIHQNLFDILKNIIIEERQFYQVHIAYLNFSDNTTNSFPGTTLSTLTSPTIITNTDNNNNSNTDNNNLKLNNTFPILKIHYNGIESQEFQNYDIYPKGTSILLNYFYQYFGKNSKRDILNDPHIVHVNNLNKINSDIIQLSNQQNSTISNILNSNLSQDKEKDKDKKDKYNLKDKNSDLIVRLNNNVNKRPKSSPSTGRGKKPQQKLRLNLLSKDLNIDKTNNFNETNITNNIINNDSNTLNESIIDSSNIDNDHTQQLDTFSIYNNNTDIKDKNLTRHRAISAESKEATLLKSSEKNQVYHNQDSSDFDENEQLSKKNNNNNNTMLTPPISSPVRQKRSLTAPPVFTHSQDNIIISSSSSSLHQQQEQSQEQQPQQQYLYKNKKVLELKKSESLNSESSDYISPQRTPILTHSKILKPLRKKEQLIQVKICAINGIDISLDIQRVKFQQDGQTIHRLLIIGYSPMCNSTTKKNCLIGDEIISINEISVEGKHIRDINRALVPIGRGNSSPIKGQMSPLASRRPSSSISNPMIPIQIRRYYPNWEKYYPIENEIDTTNTSSPTSSDIQSPNKLNHQNSFSLIEDDLKCKSYDSNNYDIVNEFSDSTTSPERQKLNEILLGYEIKIKCIKKEIQIFESNVLTSDLTNFLTNKELLLKKYDELRELQEEYFEQKISRKISQPNDFSPLNSSNLNLHNEFQNLENQSENHSIDLNIHDTIRVADSPTNIISKIYVNNNKRIDSPCSLDSIPDDNDDIDNDNDDNIDINSNNNNNNNNISPTTTTTTTIITNQSENQNLSQNLLELPSSPSIISKNPKLTQKPSMRRVMIIEPNENLNEETKSSTPITPTKRKNRNSIPIQHQNQNQNKLLSNNKKPLSTINDTKNKSKESFNNNNHNNHNNNNNNNNNTSKNNLLNEFNNTEDHFFPSRVRAASDDLSNDSLDDSTITPPQPAKKNKTKQNKTITTTKIKSNEIIPYQSPNLSNGIKIQPLSSPSQSQSKYTRQLSNDFVSKYFSYKGTNVVALSESLKYINLKYQNSSIKLRSKMKIYVWWKLVLPQRQLKHRLWVREMCLEWIYELFDVTYEKTIKSRRIRYFMLREAAAIKIQKFFRHWKLTVLSQCIRIQRCWKRYLARKMIKSLVTMTRAAIRIARYLYLRRRRLNQAVGKKILYKRVIRSFLDYVGFKIRDQRIKDSITSVLPAHLFRRTKTNLLLINNTHRRNDIYSKREKASVLIQSLFRMKSARQTLLLLKKEKEQRIQFMRTLVIVRLKRKMRLRKKKILAAIKIASIWRGCRLRWKLMISVLAGIKITSCWRRYKEYWKLKRCLRRNEIPLHIILHGIKNIPASQIHSKSIRVRVSVWWTALLHLVGESDFATVIQSKPPNIVRMTSFHTCIDQAPSKPELVPSLSFVSSSPSTTSSSINANANVNVNVNPNKSTKNINEISQNQSPIQNNIKRKLSLSQQTKLLQPHESCRNLTASEKLVQFAKENGVQGAAIKTIGNLQKQSIVSSTTKQYFKSAVQRATVVRNLSMLQESESGIGDEEEEKSSSSSSSSSDSNSDNEEDDNEEDDNEEDEDEEDNEDNDNSKNDDKNDMKKKKKKNKNNDKFDANKPLTSKLPTSNQNKIDQVKSNQSPTKHRLSFDGIGRESVNSLGTNLLPNSENIDYMALPSGTFPQLFQGSAPPSTMTTLHPHRNSLTPVTANQPVQNTFIGNALNVFKGKSISGFFETSQNLENFLLRNSTKYSVSLEDETLFIPGCHGNSVIRFDFYSGNSKFGTDIYQLSSDKSLMFWGGELTRDITLNTEKTLPRMSQANPKSKGIEKQQSKIVDKNGPTLELKIAAGAPLRSRSGWCMVSVSGNGPLKRRMRTKGFLKSFFETWDHLYISLDGDSFFIYATRNTPEPLLYLPLSDLKNLRIELADTKDITKNSATGYEDKYIVILTATTRDTIKLRFSEKFVRESWIRVIVQAVDYNRDFLSKRLIGNPLLSSALNSPNRSNPTDKRRR